MPEENTTPILTNNNPEPPAESVVEPATEEGKEAQAKEATAESSAESVAEIVSTENETQPEETESVGEPELETQAEPASETEVKSEPVLPAPVEEASPAPVETAEETVPVPDQNKTVEDESAVNAPTVREAVVEKVMEKEKVLDEAGKDNIFREKLRANLTVANDGKQARYEERLQAVIEFIKSKATFVTNQDIEEALEISDATATKYLNELIKRKLVIRVGSRYRAQYRLTAAI
jgi:hypothetical protein